MRDTGSRGNQRYGYCRGAVNSAPNRFDHRKPTPNTTAPQATQCLIRRGLVPEAVAATIRAEVRSVMGNVAITERTLKDHIDATLVRERLVTTLAAVFGGLALLLALIGLYGVVSHSVARRGKEIGFRIALGFDQRRAVSMVLREVFVLDPDVIPDRAPSG
jgi:hypothetical protein